jgi:DNA-binding response OmpR family regulator
MTQTIAPRILCVEDNQDISSYISQMLTVAGYQTIIADGLIDGLRLARSESFELYLLNYNLPDGAGVELCKQIRAINADTPLLFYSSAAEPGAEQDAIAVGAQGYIGKIEAFDILEQAITNIIESAGVKAPGPSPQMTQVPQGRFSQQEFNRFIERYNVDYHFLLLRVSTGQYNCLLTSFLVLQDLYTAIITLHEIGHFDLQIIPHPISLRSNEALLDQLGFNELEKERVDNFLKFIKETQGKEFEQILDEGALVHCVKENDLPKPLLQDH